VYRHGEKVVDLWGGVRNKATGEPWEEDTMVLVYSTTKGLAAMTLALAHSWGWLGLRETHLHLLARSLPRVARKNDHRPTVARPPSRIVCLRRSGRQRYRRWSWSI